MLQTVLETAKLTYPNKTKEAITSHNLGSQDFSENSNLDDPGIYLPVSLSSTNLKLINISVTRRMVKKVMMNLDFSKSSGADCIPFQWWF